MSKKLFRHLKWVMWKINSLESKAKFVWPRKGRERESSREWQESKNIDFNLPWEGAGETSHWNKFLKLPTSWNVEQQSENKHFCKVCLLRKDWVQSLLSCTLSLAASGRVWNTKEGRTFSVSGLWKKAPKNYGGCFTLGKDFRLQQNPACTLLKGCAQPLGLEEEEGTVMLHVLQCSSRSACIR